MHTFRLPPTPPTSSSPSLPSLSPQQQQPDPPPRSTPPSSTASNSHPTRRPNVRRPVSCTKCRLRKTRCDRKLPCASCVRHGDGVLCSYGEYASAQRQTREFVELRERLASLEKLVQQQAATAAAHGHGQLQGGGGGGGIGGGIGGLQIAPLSPPTEDVAIGDEATRDKTGWDAVLGELSYLRETYDTEPEPPDSNTPVVDPFFGTVDQPDLESLLEMLPLKDEADMLVRRYLDVFSSLVHVLHEPTFMGEYYLFWSDPYKLKPSWWALLYVVLSLGHVSFSPSSAAQRAVDLHSAALRCLVADKFMSHPTLHTVQCLILLIYAKNLTSDTETAWALLGMTTNLATTLGLHRDSGHVEPNFVIVEQRRRAWAALQMLDALQGSVFGRSCLIRSPAAADTQMPADVNDRDITPKCIKPPSTRPTQMTYLNLKFRLLKLTARIAEVNFSPTPPMYSEVQKLDMEVRNEASEWPHRYGPSHHQVHWWIIHGHYQQMFLLLHRPFWSAHPESRARCIEAARKGVEVFKAVQIPEYEPYKWYTEGLATFHAFHAAVVLGMGLKEDRNEELCREPWEEVIALLESKVEHSGVAKKAMGVLSALRRTILMMRPYSDPRSSISEESTASSSSLVMTPLPPPPNDAGQVPMTQIMDSGLFYPATVDDGGLQQWLESDVSQWLTPGSMEWVMCEPMPVPVT